MLDGTTPLADSLDFYIDDYTTSRLTKKSRIKYLVFVGINEPVPTAPKWRMVLRG